MSAAPDVDVIVLGGGAAGLMSAFVAGQRGRRVRVLEGSKRCGKKILMSGGGRCNFTNRYSSPANFLSSNPHYCKSALARYTPSDFTREVERHGIAYHEKERGQLFCDVASKQIVAMLLAECEQGDVQVRTGVHVETVALENGRFIVRADGECMTCASLVVATGGLSIPKMGASGLGYDIARQFGLPIVPLRAALVPFTLDAAAQQTFGALSGIGASVEATCNDGQFDAGLLFTHRGLSGPAMLQVSSYWQPGDRVTVDFLPEKDIVTWLGERRQARPDARLHTVLAEVLPRRLAVALCDESGAQALGSRALRRYSGEALSAVAERLAAWPFLPNGTEGYRTAEVTLGGVDTTALSSATMAARDVAGLYFIGEVVDVTGHLGGHNFQWAWASAQAAGQAV